MFFDLHDNLMKINLKTNFFLLFFDENGKKIARKMKTCSEKNCQRILEKNNVFAHEIKKLVFQFAMNY